MYIILNINNNKHKIESLSNNELNIKINYKNNKNEIIFYPIQLYLYDCNNILIDKYYISKNQIELEIYTDIVVFYKYPLFDNYISFKSKNKYYKFNIFNDNDNNLYIKNIKIKNLKKYNFLQKVLYCKL